MSNQDQVNPTLDVGDAFVAHGAPQGLSIRYDAQAVVPG